MCGLFQVIQRGVPIARERFEAALATMSHRGPDSRGVEFDQFAADSATIHVASGHQRLSILDLSEQSRQPFRRDGKTLLYNGEIYNYRDIARELSARGVEFDSTGDTEVLFRAMVTDGTRAWPRLSGMWAATLLDPEQLTLTVARDRYGKKPLFYYQDETTICFSSTIRAITHYLGRPPVFRRDALLGYFANGTMFPTESEQTHFHDIHQILPGHSGCVDLRTWQLKSAPFFDWFHSDEDGPLDDEDQLAETVRDAVDARLVSDRPVALLLSGGIDSSLLFSVLSSTGADQRLHVFLGDTGRSDDYEYARRCVEACGATAETVTLDYESQTFDLFLEVCAHQEKPFLFNGNALAMPQMYRAIAARGIPVVLDGTGGDEIFGGYWGRQLPYAFRQALHDSDTDWINDVCGANHDLPFVRKSLEWARKHPDGRDEAPTTSLALQRRLHPFLRYSWREARELRNPDPIASLHGGFTDCLCRDIAPGGRLGEWLWHNDRNAMMSSVENRSPLLDHRLHRYLFTGYRRKFSGAWNKFELRRLFSRFAELPTQWRREKQGFRWHGSRFMQNNRAAILEIIGESAWCSEVFNTKLFVRCAARLPKLLSSSLAKRALCIAGLEQALA